MNSASKINVIIPVYNVEHYLEQCVRFILEQSYSVFERLLVDDGSTDGSGELCERARRSAAVNDIVFLGRRDDPQNFPSQVDICVMPSLWEGLPLVLLEALSGGVPVVANACDGILDVRAMGKMACSWLRLMRVLMSLRLSCFVTTRHCATGLGRRSARPTRRNTRSRPGGNVVWTSTGRRCDEREAVQGFQMGRVRPAGRQSAFCCRE